MKYSKTVTEYLLHVSVHEIETNEGDLIYITRKNYKCWLLLLFFYVPPPTILT